MWTVYITDLVSPDLISFDLISGDPFHLIWMAVKRCSSPWLWPITAHSVRTKRGQLRSGQMRWDEMSGMNAAVCLSADIPSAWYGRAPSNVGRLFVPWTALCHQRAASHGTYTRYGVYRRYFSDAAYLHRAITRVSSNAYFMVMWSDSSQKCRYYFALGRDAIYCDQRICLFVCLSVRLYARVVISKTTCLNFIEFSAHIACMVD